MSKRKTTIYAAYKGDRFLIADYADKVAEYLETSERNVRWMSTPAYKRRIKHDKGLIIITFKDEEVLHG
ncbi:hypothetical protein IV487_01790 [Enterococcus saccharolyticus]|uniref:hypothetical protein n=1 Tax=Enterococcus saccharolyticus TaxID=41997 RepID=UPI001E457321|nr:hypothetical protein [Enterococcus saccharolyticus]MCD5001195.1 hypothetical protein [Enterococcus saccharolyticus]